MPLLNKLSSTFLLLFVFFGASSLAQQAESHRYSYSVVIDDPSGHTVQVKLKLTMTDQDCLVLKMPNWMPGYYQLMDYSDNVSGVAAVDESGQDVDVEQTAKNSWRLAVAGISELNISYEVKADEKFVAKNYVDNSHAYLVPAGIFMYEEGAVLNPVTIEFENHPWKHIATGLPEIAENVFFAEDFDVLYDSPFLIGDLEELPPFEVNGVPHRFIGYEMGEFDKVLFMGNLKKVVESAVSLIGDIPFEEYTFIAIGPGRGGIEHLNNTTVSFSGDGLGTADGMERMMNFLAHEYYHHYNVKRIRPFELGPFDYDKGTKTNLLWVSEGLSVYYEYLITARAGLMDERALLSNLESNINEFENDPGREHQSLVEASFATWGDGPFGTMGKGADRSISYYAKGPVVGMLLDFAIRNATENKLSLDDVMRRMYWHYYKELGRGFTDAEFQQTCEEIAGVPLTEVFEYVYTTQPLDYNKFLGYAGLEIEKENTKQGKFKFRISRKENSNALQQAIFESWLGKD